MTQTPGKISRDSFKKMLAGNKGYLPSKVTRELKKGGLSHLLYKSSISKEQAIKAIRYLRKGSGNQPVISKFKPPTQLYRETALKQQEKNSAAEETRHLKHIQARRKMDLAEEETAIEQGKNPYNPHSAIGQSVAQEIAQEQEKRAKKSRQQRQKKEQHDKLQITRGTGPELADLGTLREMNID